MPFWSERKVAAAEPAGTGGGALTGAGSERDAVGEAGNGSPLRVQLRWICQLVSENLALSC